MLRYVAIASGEASGTAAEVVIKTVQSKPFGGFGGIVVIGDLEVYKKVSADLMLPLPFSAFCSTDDELIAAENDGEQYIFYDCSNINMKEFEYGKPSKDTGLASFKALETANRIICNRMAFTLVTTKISRQAIASSNLEVNNLTDILSRLSSSDRVINMLASGKANVFSLTKEMSIKQAVDMVTRENILDALVNIDSLFSSSYFNTSLPIAVAALNPPKGDGSWYGQEESEIESAIDIAKKFGINAIGPIDTDKIYKDALMGRYSAVLCMIRQGAFSVLSSSDTVEISWGLPYMRVGLTSEMGLSEAGKGCADISNMEKALEIAVQISDKGVFA